MIFYASSFLDWVTLSRSPLKKRRNRANKRAELNAHRQTSTSAAMTKKRNRRNKHDIQSAGDDNTMEEAVSVHDRHYLDVYRPMLHVPCRFNEKTASLGPIFYAQKISTAQQLN